MTHKVQTKLAKRDPRSGIRSKIEYFEAGAFEEKCPTLTVCSFLDA